MLSAIATTKNNANTVNISRMRVSVMYLNNGAEMYLPASMMLILANFLCFKLLITAE